MNDLFNIPKQTFTKQDAIEQQLDAAIDLFFNQKSIIAIYTLCSASFAIIKDLARSAAPSFEKEVQSLGNKIKDPKYTKYANFFKHADRDPQDSIDFHVSQCCLKLMFACVGFKKIGRKRTRSMEIYLIWMFAFFNDLFFLEEETKEMFEKIKVDHKINIDNITFEDARLVGLNILRDKSSSYWK